jgi:hypothetical protein
VRFAFLPNPAFQTSTYQERVMDVMEGTVSVKEPEDRLCDLEATISQPVEFGYGLLDKLSRGDISAFNSSKSIGRVGNHAHQSAPRRSRSPVEKSVPESGGDALKYRSRASTFELRTSCETDPSLTH